MNREHCSFAVHPSQACESVLHRGADAPQSEESRQVTQVCESGSQMGVSPEQWSFSVQATQVLEPRSQWARSPVHSDSAWQPVEASPPSGVGPPSGG